MIYICIACRGLHFFEKKILKINLSDIIPEKKYEKSIPTHARLNYQHNQRSSQVNALLIQFIILKIT